MNSSVEAILRKHYVDGVFHTHVSMVQPRGKFQFTRQGLEIFWDSYCDRLQENKDSILGVAEKPQHYLPVLADIDIKITDRDDLELDEHLYTFEQAKQVIEVYQSILRNMVEQCTDENLLCILLEKPLYYITTDEIIFIKNGFHLHFPNLFLNKIDQEIHLIPRVQQTLKEMNVFTNLGIADSGTVVDNSYCKVPWLMYGSRKSENMDPYTATKSIFF